MTSEREKGEGLARPGIEGESFLGLDQCLGARGLHRPPPETADREDSAGERETGVGILRVPLDRPGEESERGLEGLPGRRGTGGLPSEEHEAVSLGIDGLLRCEALRLLWRHRDTGLARARGGGVALEGQDILEITRVALGP